MYGQIAYAFHTLGEYEAALYYYKKQLQVTWDENVKNIETDIYDNIGMEYYYLGDMEKSIFYHTASMNDGLKIGKLEKMMSPKSKENIRKEFRQDFLIKGGVKSMSEEFIEKTYEIRCNAKLTQRMKYIKERKFSEDLTRILIERVKKELKRDLLPSPRRMQMRFSETKILKPFSSMSSLPGISPNMRSTSNNFTYFY